MAAPISSGLWPKTETPVTKLGNAARWTANTTRSGLRNPKAFEELRGALEEFSWTIVESDAVARQLRVYRSFAAVWLSETIELLRRAEEIDDDSLARLETLGWAFGQIS